MTIIAILAAIAVAILISIFLGPFGGILLLATIFGLVFSTHQRNKKIYDDLQRIKEHLGIVDRDDFNMTNEEIEHELEQEEQEDSEEMNQINEEIEKELEQYADEKGEHDKGRKS
ncbi:hypothetical protein ACFQZT_10330 [Paenibacillus sp. GCM10027628]|uniref:hypothetical protein n=1 Tax=Paenibacillus sp. GCM10027628 TaxID=3273413 RepID=UPI0036370FF7